MEKEHEAVRIAARHAYDRANLYPMYSASWQYWTSTAHGLERLLVPGAHIRRRAPKQEVQHASAT